MSIRPKKRTGKSKEMSIDQQIQECEERIADLENWKRAMAMGEFNQQKVQHYEGNLERDLDQAYEHVTLLKIRRMMGY